MLRIIANYTTGWIDRWVLLRLMCPLKKYVVGDVENQLPEKTIV